MEPEDKNISDMESQNTKKRTEGVARIKEDFLLDAKKPVGNARDLIGDAAADLVGEPPAKRKKLKGQNKKRPRDARIPNSEKLCMKFLSDSKCPYGGNCCYSHDIVDFMSKKPEDIGPQCYLYKTFGKCDFGLNCRFGLSHISQNHENVINDDLWKVNKDIKFSSNYLSRDLHQSLRMRKYNFDVTKKVLKNLEQLNTKTENLIENNDSTKEVMEEKFDVTIETSNGNSLEKMDPKEASVQNCEILKSNCTPEAKINVGSLSVRKEKKQVDFKDKLYLAPLTTVGNLPFRRICKEYGADITCGEMSLCSNLLQGKQSEWALLRRHSSEDLFGIQVCGAHHDMMSRCAQVIDENVDVDFVDINMGCPIDLVYKKGAGSGLMGKTRKLHGIIYGMSSILSVPLTIKLRTGIYENKRIAHTLISKLHEWGPTQVSLITLHGRSREQRYTRSADWNYISECASIAKPIPLFGNGDILSFQDYNIQKELSGVSGIMIARGALIKPWIFTEIKEQRHWDISSTERLENLRKYTNYGLEHWGSDAQGVENTRRFLLEWLSFLYRYIPVGILECIPQKINERPPAYHGRDDLETLMASPNCADWIKISEMLLGPVPKGFIFLPKHKANSYS